MSSNGGWSLPEPDGYSPVPIGPPPEIKTATPEDPPFSGFEVLLIGLWMFVVPVLILAPVLVIAFQKVLYPHLPLKTVAEKPWVLLGPQFAWFALVLLFLIGYSKVHFRQSLWQAIRWNWPRRTWLALVVIGVATLLGLQALERVLPLPKNSPFDQFFVRPVDAYAFTFLAVGFAPLMEELFFRGFMYPVLARRLGIITSVVLTAMTFALIHAPEYHAWGPVLIVFLVGIVLTSVRAKLKSVGASFIVHSIYNGVPIFAALIASHGFRHLDKLAQ
jgi:flagellin-like protein